MGNYIKVSGAWKIGARLWTKVSGVWREIEKLWTKVAGVWRLGYQKVPTNMILFSTTLPANCTAQSGLHGYYPASYSSGGSTGGSNLHVYGHGAFTGYTSLFFHPQCYFQWWFTQSRTLYSSHRHGCSHTHDVSGVSIEPEYQTFVPYTCNYIPSGTLFLATQALSEMTLITGYDYRYMKYDSSCHGGGSSTHSHSITLNTDEWGDHDKDTTGNSHAWSWSHYHTANHTHTDANDPQAKYFRLYRLDKNISGIDELPSGTCAFFNSTTLPTGWTSASIGDLRLIRFYQSATTETCGVATHTCSAFNGSTGSSIRTDTGYCDYNARITYTVDPLSETHTHTINHSHTTAVNSMPQYYTMVLARKD
jgi:hypothetical protein